MISRILALLGLILLVLGILKFVGLITIASAGAVTLIVIGAVLILVAEFVLGDGFLGATGRRRL